MAILQIFDAEQQPHPCFGAAQIASEHFVDSAYAVQERVSMDEQPVCRLVESAFAFQVHLENIYLFQCVIR